MSRLHLVDEWTKVFPETKDIIFRTKQGFIIKSNNAEENLKTALNHLKEENKITSYNETRSNHANNTYQPRLHKESYSAVISYVDIEIKEEEISQA